MEVRVEATDPDGIAKVELYDKKTLLGTATSTPYTFTITLPKGNRTLRAEATDNAGKSASDSVKIKVK